MAGQKLGHTERTGQEMPPGAPGKDGPTATWPQVGPSRRLTILIFTEFPPPSFNLICCAMFAASGAETTFCQSLRKVWAEHEVTHTHTQEHTHKNTHTHTHTHTQAGTHKLRHTRTNKGKYVKTNFPYKSELMNW